MNKLFLLVLEWIRYCELVSNSYGEFSLVTRSPKNLLFINDLLNSSCTVGAVILFVKLFVLLRLLQGRLLIKALDYFLVVPFQSLQHLKQIFLLLTITRNKILQHGLSCLVSLLYNVCIRILAIALAHSLHVVLIDLILIWFDSRKDYRLILLHFSSKDRREVGLKLCFRVRVNRLHVALVVA